MQEIHTVYVRIRTKNCFKCPAIHLKSSIVPDVVEHEPPDRCAVGVGDAEELVVHDLLGVGVAQGDGDGLSRIKWIQAREHIIFKQLKKFGLKYVFSQLYKHKILS